MKQRARSAHAWRIFARSLQMAPAGLVALWVFLREGARDVSSYRGSPRIRCAMTLRWISEVPPMIVSERA